jgi:hypothetical protein
MSGENEGPQSTGEILTGDGSNQGLRHETSGGASITTGPTSDPAVPDGNYISVTNDQGSKTTIVYDSGGNAVKKS